MTMRQHPAGDAIIDSFQSLFDTLDDLLGFRVQKL